MSNFAERLIARNAGVPPARGISVLAPRPVSRFEPVPAIEIATEAAPAGSDARIEHEAESQIGPAAVPTNIDRGDTRQPLGKPEIARPVPLEEAIRKPRYEAEIRRPMLRQDSSRRPPPDVRDTPRTRADLAETRYAPRNVTHGDIVTPDIPRQSARADIEMHHPTREEPNGRVPPPFAARAVEARAAPIDQHTAVPARQSSNAGEVAPAPVISIGKIEVQFLPQEPRMPAPRPPPQRTRGFEAYARARRGEPR